MLEIKNIKKAFSQNLVLNGIDLKLENGEMKEFSCSKEIWNLIEPGEVIEFEVNGDRIQAVHMLPGYTHNIINLSETENLVTVMYCNEIFDPNKPDTFFEPVQ